MDVVKQQFVERERGERERNLEKWSGDRSI